MKIFFYTSPVSSSFDNQVKHIYRELVNLGYVHTSDEAMTHVVRDILSKDKNFSQVNKEKYNTFIKGFLDAVAKSDICIFEASFQSLGLGYLIDKSLEMAKPTIVLYYEGNVPHILNVVDDDKLIVQSYDDKNIDSIIRKTINDAREKRDKRFNFFLSPKLLQYIDDASKERGVTKSKLLRDMIVKHMRETAVE
ncbi:MAG: hypothetical protein Q8P72_05955 [Candidatus Roizmanbacteria bacterium]|nr:hypothetical protein [Candidatus Roizmanbacteria bacterium]